MFAAAEALAIAQVCTSDVRRALPAYLALMGAGAAIALLAARSLSAARPWVVVVCGAALRATLLLGAPDLSDDAARYAWDGRVSAAGISPYAYAPADRSLDAIAREIPRPPHAEVRTVYPPVAQAVFRAAAWARGRETLALRAAFAAADAAVVPLIYALGGPAAAWAGALYAFHPLAITESARQGHLDSLGVLLLLASIVYLVRGRRVRGGVAFALSVLTKWVPLAAALPLLRRGRSAFAAAAGATAVALGALAWRGASPAGGLGLYAQRWEFNSLLYPALVRVFERTGLPDAAKAAWISAKAALGHPAWMQAAFPYFYAGFLARATLALLLAAALVTILRLRDTETAVFASLCALLLASPTLHPWYLVWILPFAARRRDPAALWITFAAPAAYALLYPFRGVPPGAVLAFEYAPAALLLIGSLARRARGAAAASAA